MAIQSMYGTNNDEENQGTTPISNYLSNGSTSAKNLSTAQQPMYQQSKAGNAGSWTNLIDVVKANDPTRTTNRLNTAADNKIQTGVKSVTEEIGSMPALPTANTYTSSAFTNILSGGIDPNEMNQLKGYMGVGEQAQTVDKYEKKNDLTVNPFKDFDTSKKSSYNIDTIQGIFGKPTGTYSQGMGLLDELLYGNTPGWKELGTKLNDRWDKEVANPYNEAVTTRQTKEAEKEAEIKKAQKEWREAGSGRLKALDDELEQIYNSLTSNSVIPPRGINSDYQKVEKETGVSTMPYYTVLNPATKQDAFGNMGVSKQNTYLQLEDLMKDVIGADEGYVDRGLTQSWNQYKPEFTFNKPAWESAATTAGKGQWTQGLTDKFNNFISTSGFNPGSTISQGGHLYKVPTLDEYINSQGNYDLYNTPTMSDVTVSDLGLDPNYDISNITLPAVLDPNYDSSKDPSNYLGNNGNLPPTQSDYDVQKHIDAVLANLPKEEVPKEQAVKVNKKGTKNGTYKGIYGGGR